MPSRGSQEPGKAKVQVIAALLFCRNCRVCRDLRTPNVTFCQ